MIEFALPIRVYIEDTDAGGIVFYANYLKYFERARTELVRSRGYQLRSSMASNINYVVHSLELKYIKPARLDDQIVAWARIGKVARTYFLVEQWVSDEAGETLVKGSVKIACTHLDSGRPRSLTEDLLRALT